MKQLRAGDVSAPTFALLKEDLFAPIAKEVTTFARHLSDAKAAAVEEARLRQSAESLWTPERLKEHVKAKLNGRTLFVVSNREPYMHIHKGRKVECMVPAGGLVTALEPVLRASNGTWIAHGAGDADFEMVDDKNRLKVPPRRSPLYLKTRAPHQGRGERLLLRVFQRGDLASLPYCPYAARVSRRGLGPVSGGQSQIRRNRSARN